MLEVMLGVEDIVVNAIYDGFIFKWFVFSRDFYLERILDGGFKLFLFEVSK